MANQLVRTNIELDQGLRKWVGDYIMARHYGNIELAKRLKQVIDEIIQAKDLDGELVYLCYGDPDAK